LRIRSDFAVTRLILLPYGALLALYLLVVGGGGVWLYRQVQGVETRILFDEVTGALAPVVERLEGVDPTALRHQPDPALYHGLEVLFAALPALRQVTMSGANGGVEFVVDRGGAIRSGEAPPLPVPYGRADRVPSPAQRLHAESDARFHIRFDLSHAATAPVRLDFGFDRAALVARVDQGVGILERFFIAFVAAGTASILAAVAISLAAMGVTRKLEVHYQELYQRASLTEIAASLVHDLRNPLAALRANSRALLVSPHQTKEIVAELDRDIVALNDKLSAFLNLTRRHDDDLEPASVRELVQDAARLAEPVLAGQGLAVGLAIPPDLPPVCVRKASVRDALLNILINAAQSGQTQGAVQVAARVRVGWLEILVEDRGKGIPTQHLPHLFDPFYTTREKGTGLGLAIVRRVAADHQGEVYAENRAEGGARVVLRLPLERREVPAWWNKLKRAAPHAEAPW